jgi:hypothetical protein
LIEAIEQQPFVRHDRGFAERLADVAELKPVEPESFRPPMRPELPRRLAFP